MIHVNNNTNIIDDSFQLTLVYIRAGCRSAPSVWASLTTCFDSHAQFLLDLKSMNLS